MTSFHRKKLIWYCRSQLDQGNGLVLLYELKAHYYGLLAEGLKSTSIIKFLKMTLTDLSW